MLSLSDVNELPNWIQACAAIGLVLISFVTLVVLCGYAADTRTIAKNSSEQMESLRNSERAWVLVEKAWVRPGQIRSSVVSPIITNFGKSIARVRKVALSASFLQINEELPASPVYEGNQELDFVLYPGREFEPIDVPVGGENFNAVTDGMLILYLYGLIEYIDFGGQKKFTGFCLVWDRKKGDFTPAIKAPAAYTRYG